MRTFTNVLLTSLFCELLYALPEIIKEELCNDHVLDKHRKTIEEKIAEGIDILNDPDQDVSALCHDVKSYMVMIKHHIQSTKARFQDISLFSSVGRNEGDSLEILEISSMSLSPLRARLATAYKAKNKRSGNQHKSPGIDGERVVKSIRENIRQEQKETPRSHYETPLKGKAKLVIDVALNTTPTNEAHRAVSAVMKKRKS